GVFHSRIARGALSFLAEQPCWSHKTSRLETIRAKFISRRCNSVQRFIVVQVVKFTFLLRVKSREELVVKTLFCTARALVKIPVNDNFMTVRFQASQPGHKLLVSREQPLMMIIRDDEKRTNTHPAPSQF